MMRNFSLKGVLILIMVIYHASSSLQKENTEDEPTLTSNLNKTYSFEPTQKLIKTERVIRKRADEFLEENSIFSSSISTKQTSLCGMNYLSAENPADQYCTFPIHLAPSHNQCSKKPEPVVIKLEISDSITLKGVPCGYEGRGELYQFVYRICTTREPTSDDNSTQQSNFDLNSNSIKERIELEVYRFCYNANEEEILYTRHEILSAVHDEKSEQEQEKSYVMMTNGYQYFNSHFEIIAEQYSKLEEKKYEVHKLIPSNHFPFALWRKTTYHYLNTMPMRKKLGNLWNEIFDRIRKDGEQRGRRYLMLTRAFSINDQEETKRKFSKPDIWITIVRYIERGNDENVHFLVSIILNNRFSRKSTSPMTKIIVERYCPENLCENAFSTSFPKISDSVHCCKVNDNIKRLFEENLIVDEILKPDFLFDSGIDPPKQAADENQSFLQSFPSFTSLLPFTQSN